MHTTTGGVFRRWPVRTGKRCDSTREALQGHYSRSYLSENAHHDNSK